MAIEIVEFPNAIVIFYSCVSLTYGNSPEISLNHHKNLTKAPSNRSNFIKPTSNPIKASTNPNQPPKNPSQPPNNPVQLP